jgi:arylsulfatase A-like enzyme
LGVAFASLNEGTDATTPAGRLQMHLLAAGYVTGHFGKWHLGGEGHLPTTQGFDVNPAGNATGSPKGGYQAAGVNARDITANAPLRGGKGMLYESGVRVPLIVRYPGRVAAGSASSLPVMCVDFLPTLLELAGLPPEQDRPIDGTSFAGELLGRQAGADRPPIYWHFPGYLEAGPVKEGSWRTTPAGAIRKGRYKLVEFFETGKVELYDLARDIGERNDLASTESAKARELKADLAAWRARLKAKMPKGK